MQKALGVIEVVVEQIERLCFHGAILPELRYAITAAWCQERSERVGGAAVELIGGLSGLG